jgi:hypothetical protein
MATSSSNLASFLASKKSPQKRFYRKAFTFKDSNWINPTTVTVTNTPHGMAPAVAMLHSIHKLKMNFGPLGLGIFHTVHPREKRSNSKFPEKDFESIAILDLDSFVSNFGDSEAVANALERECEEVMSEWQADNGSKDKVGCRIPVERTFNMARYTWESRNRREESEYDTQLSKCSWFLIASKLSYSIKGTWAFTKQNQHREQPEPITLNHIKVFLSFVHFIFLLFVFSLQVLIKLKSTVGITEVPDASVLIDGRFRYDHYK